MKHKIVLPCSTASSLFVRPCVKNASRAGWQTVATSQRFSLFDLDHTGRVSKHARTRQQRTVHCLRHDFDFFFTAKWLKRKITVSPPLIVGDAIHPAQAFHFGISVEKLDRHPSYRPTESVMDGQKEPSSDYSIVRLIDRLSHTSLPLRYPMVVTR